MYGRTSRVMNIITAVTMLVTGVCLPGTRVSAGTQSVRAQITAHIDAGSLTPAAVGDAEKRLAAPEDGYAEPASALQQQEKKASAGRAYSFITVKKGQWPVIVLGVIVLVKAILMILNGPGSKIVTAETANTRSTAFALKPLQPKSMDVRPDATMMPARLTIPRFAAPAQFLMLPQGINALFSDTVSLNARLKNGIIVTRFEVRNLHDYDCVAAIAEGTIPTEDYWQECAQQALAWYDARGGRTAFAAQDAQNVYEHMKRPAAQKKTYILPDVKKLKAIADSLPPLFDHVVAIPAPQEALSELQQVVQQANAAEKPVSEKKLTPAMARFLAALFQRAGQDVFVLPNEALTEEMPDETYFFSQQFINARRHPRVTDKTVLIEIHIDSDYGSFGPMAYPRVLKHVTNPDGTSRYSHWLEYDHTSIIETIGMSQLATETPDLFLIQTAKKIDGLIATLKKEFPDATSFAFIPGHGGTTGHCYVSPETGFRFAGREEYYASGTMRFATDSVMTWQEKTARDEAAGRWHNVVMRSWLFKNHFSGRDIAHLRNVGVFDPEKSTRRKLVFSDAIRCGGLDTLFWKMAVLGWPSDDVRSRMMEVAFNKRCVEMLFEDEVALFGLKDAVSRTGVPVGNRRTDHQGVNLSAGQEVCRAALSAHVNAALLTDDHAWQNRIAAMNTVPQEPRGDEMQKAHDLLAAWCKNNETMLWRIMHTYFKQRSELEQDQAARNAVCHEFSLILKRVLNTRFARVLVKQNGGAGFFIESGTYSIGKEAVFHSRLVWQQNGVKRFILDPTFGQFDPAYHDKFLLIPYGQDPGTMLAPEKAIGALEQNEQGYVQYLIDRMRNPESLQHHLMASDLFRSSAHYLAMTFVLSEKINHGRMHEVRDNAYETFLITIAQDMLSALNGSCAVPDVRAVTAAFPFLSAA